MRSRRSTPFGGTTMSIMSPSFSHKVFTTHRLTMAVARETRSPQQPKETELTGWSRSTLVTMVIVCCLTGVARRVQAEDLCSKPPFTSSKNNGVVTITVDWAKLVHCTSNEKNKGIDARIGLRISEDEPVNVLVTNFNFINYTISYKVEETVVETYVMLEKLWSQLLGMPLFGTPSLTATEVRAHERKTCAGFQQCGANWAFKIATVRIILDEYLTEAAGKTHVTDKTSIRDRDRELKAFRTDILGMLKVIVDNVANRPSTITEVSQFETLLANQEALFAKIDAYHAAAELVANGKVYPVGKKKAGTIVSVSMTPKDQNQADGRPTTTTEYFVHSKLPVLFHAGYAYTEFQNVKFETVRSLSQTDLFSEVRQNNESLNVMAAFVSLGRSFLVDEKVGAFFSIGTDFSDPGDRLYLGVSLQLYKRFFFTVGKMSASVSEGVNPVFERVGEAAQARELFTAIGTHRDWSQTFYSMSFRVF
jgi:hypothetical protein